MKQALKRYGKIIAFDFLAVLCFIGVILFGWLPGPGGIPLFLLGLSLLAANHDWAERWLDTAKHHGVSFRKWLFPDKLWVQRLYDCLVILVLSVAGYVIYKFEHRLIEAVAIGAIISSLFVFLINRDRFGKMSELVKKLKRFIT